jgi:hypothetical protein
MPRIVRGYINPAPTGSFTLPAQNLKARSRAHLIRALDMARLYLQRQRKKI